MMRKTDSEYPVGLESYELDFLSVEADKSGDAIAMRYVKNGVEYVHVVDGGFQSTGERLVEHLHAYYGAEVVVDHVIATHNDGDHAGGLRKVLETVPVLNLWMHRPWIYAANLLPDFPTYTSEERLRSRLRSLYPNLAALEEIAIGKKIPISAPFQGSQIGSFTVLAPSWQLYRSLLLRSERTPETKPETEMSEADRIFEALKLTLAKAVRFVRGAWGEEIFSPEDTSAENEMSIVQYANISGHRILLTADAGRESLTEAADFAPHAGLTLPGIYRFQVPHHGSRRNVSTALLDRWLGARQSQRGEANWTAIISSAKADKLHPRRSVVRAMIHRGAKVFATEGQSMRFANNDPARPNWGPVTPANYPEDQEE